MSAPKEQPPENTLFIVGIGASAGGLDALSKLVATLPDDHRLAVIVAQHVSPDHKSKMVELLTRHATWPVMTAENEVVVQSQHVYITPPDCEITIVQGKIVIKKQHRTVHAVPSVDGFFTSLAEDQKKRAIGIILSGTGQDGTKGIAAIQLHEGYVLVQSPEEAQHQGMPDAAIQSGHVNSVLPVSEMGAQMVEYLDNQGSPTNKKTPGTSLQRIFGLMTRKTGTDFSQYKSSTIGRRIQKRLEALDVDTIDNYYQYIQHNPDEVDILFQTVLIGVTEFFRDKPTYDRLREYIKKIIAQKQPGEAIRVWSVGCATGEEPYSIAILLAEELGEHRHKHTVQIFATDIDENALATGRRGFYPDDRTENLSEQQLATFFNRGNDGYEVKKSLRQWLLFSKHDISRDPPFVRLDLVSCRNMLIYFDNELQRKVMPVFHYALNPEGYLLLGKSENVAQLSDLFTKEISKYKLFKKKTDVELNTLRYTNFPPSKLEQTKDVPIQPEVSIKEAAEQTLLRTYEHPFVVVNDALEVVHVRGKLQPYTDLSEGSLNANILKIVCRELHLELRTTFAKAKREGQPQRSNILRFQSFDQERLVRITVKPFLYQRNDSDYYLVVFEGVEPLEQYPFLAHELDLDRDEDRAAIRVMELEHELAATKEHLQTFTEELETSNEELQSMNEELQSSNEELKSSNEELETSNEELQSSNEELQTANAELAISNENLIEKETELVSISESLAVNRDRFRLALDNSPIILFYQDTDLRYTWQYNNHPGFKIDDVIGKSDYELLGKEYEELIALKVKALTTAENVHTIVTIHGVTYDITIKPMRQKEQIVGIKGVAIDVSEQIAAQRTIEENQAIIRSIIDSSEENILAVDEDYRVIVANPAQQEEFHRLFDKELNTGDNILELLRDYPDSQASTHEMFDQALKGKNTKVERYESTRIDEMGNQRYYDIDIVPIRKTTGEVLGGALMSREVTGRVIAERHIESVIERNANLVGDSFFKNLTEQITTLYGVKYVYIGLLDLNKNEVQTKALRISGKLTKNFTYGLQGVPCLTVANNEEARYIEQVSQQFPDDPKLQRWNAESYLGIPIASPLNGEPLAILVMIDEKPLRVIPDSDYVLKIFTLRAGAELERLRAEKQVREKEEQIRNITENVTDVIYEFVTPAEGKPYFRFISRAITDIYELSPKEVLNNSDRMYDVIHPDDQHLFLGIRDQLAGGAQKKATWEGRIIGARSKKVKWVIATAKTEEQANGDLVWYGTISDITLLKDVQLRLREAKEQAEEAAQVKEDFLATMSHEIRTPLNAIVGLSGLLLDQNPQPQQLENLRSLRFSSENLMNLINDILDFSKIEAGKVEAESVPFSLSELLNSLRQAHRLQATKNHNRLIIHRDAEVPEFVTGDQVKLGQVLNNLLSNALKFTEDGQVTLTVTHEQTKDNDVTVHFSVKDTGIGIPPDKLSTIFDKFTQADNSTRRHYGGTGLGLTITSMLLELMHSRIQVESQPGQGSTFRFSLPLAPADEASVAALQRDIPPLNDNRLSAVRLLIVEDVDVNRMILRQYLQNWGNASTDEAVNGKEAVRKVTENEYDLILMDVRMPVMDGYEATQIIRSMPNKKGKVPIIALTADTSDKLKENGTTYFTDVITKPFDPQELNAKIAQHTAATQTATSMNPSEVASKEVTPSLMNFARAEKPFSTSDQLHNFYQIIHRTFLEHRTNYTQAMNQHDAEQLDNLIHKLKLTLAMFEMDTLDRQLKQDAKLLTTSGMRTIHSATQRTLGLFDDIIRQVEERQQTLGIADS